MRADDGSGVGQNFDGPLEAGIGRHIGIDQHHHREIGRDEQAHVGEVDAGTHLRRVSAKVHHDALVPDLDADLEIHERLIASAVHPAGPCVDAIGNFRDAGAGASLGGVEHGMAGGRHGDAPATVSQLAVEQLRRHRRLAVRAEAHASPLDEVSHPARVVQECVALEHGCGPREVAAQHRQPQ